MEEIADVLSGKSRWAVVQGDCIDVLNSLPADSVNLCFGSPPYVDCRTYLEDGVDLGISRETEEWVAWMLIVYRACLRVSVGASAMVVEGKTENFSYDCAPDLLKADLRRSGVTLRKSPLYHRFGVPGSGGDDYLKNRYEPIVFATRGGRLPWSDNTACGQPPKYRPGGGLSNRRKDGSRDHRGRNRDGSRKITCAENRGEIIHRKRRGSGKMEVQAYIPPDLANPGNVVEPTYTREEVEAIIGGPVEAGDMVWCKAGGGHLGSNLAHVNEAPFPEALAEFFVLSFCPPNGLVLDPFAGSGTTLAAAIKHGRRAIGIDLRPSQVALTKRRLSGVTPSLFGE